MRLLGIVCGVLLSLSVGAQGNPVLTGIVTGVIDGDTIKVQLSTGPVAVRLAHIDAPESHQPSGDAATRGLNRRLLTQEVSLQVVSRNSEERLVAVVHRGDENVNAWMVKRGHALAYRGFTQDPDYCVWENAARSLRRGLWKDQDLIAPLGLAQGAKRRPVLRHGPQQFQHGELHARAWRVPRPRRLG